MNKLYEAVDNLDTFTSNEEGNVTATIYQIPDIENCKYAFMSWDFAEDKFNFDDYDKIATITVPDSEYVLDNIFMIGNTDKGKFNILKPMRSISVSDIIEINGKKYYVNDLGFQKLDESVHLKESKPSKVQKSGLSLTECKKLIDFLNEFVDSYSTHSVTTHFYWDPADDDVWEDENDIVFNDTANSSAKYYNEEEGKEDIIKLCLNVNIDHNYCDIELMHSPGGTGGEFIGLQIMDEKINNDTIGRIYDTIGELQKSFNVSDFVNSARKGATEYLGFKVKYEAETGQVPSDWYD